MVAQEIKYSFNVIFDRFCLYEQKLHAYSSGGKAAVFQLEGPWLIPGFPGPPIGLWQDIACIACLHRT